MKRLLIIALLLTINTFLLAQKVNFYPAYVADAKSAENLIKSNAKHIIKAETALFIVEYPVLISIKDFKKYEKYSLINCELVKDYPECKKNKLVFHLINGEKYTIKIKKRIYFF